MKRIMSFTKNILGDVGIIAVTVRGHRDTDTHADRRTNKHFIGNPKQPSSTIHFIS